VGNKRAKIAALNESIWPHLLLQTFFSSLPFLLWENASSWWFLSFMWFDQCWPFVIADFQTRKKPVFIVFFSHIKRIKLLRDCIINKTFQISSFSPYKRESRIVVWGGKAKKEINNRLTVFFFCLIFGVLKWKEILWKDRIT
jgi:hypothetical protein